MDLGGERRVRRTPSDAAFEQFFREHLGRAIAVARRVTRDPASAEDAAVEAMAKAHARWRSLGDDPRRGSWVVKVAMNEAIRKLPRAPAPVEPRSGADVSEEVALRHTLTTALASLPPRQREVLVLRYLVGLSEREVASTLDLSLGTVKTHIRRGLARLRAGVGSTLKEDLRAQPA